MNLIRIFAIIFALGFGTTVFAQTPSQLVFTSSENWVGVGEVVKLVVQVQDSKGVSVKLTEGMDILLRSTSESGEFSSNSTNWKNVPILGMNSNTANRTFYYRDSSAGEVTITVSGLSSITPATLKLTVGGTQPVSNKDDSGDDDDENNDDDYVSSSGYVSSSNRSCETTLSSRTTGSWSISAGPARRVVVGLPIEFEATTGSVSNSDRYKWSFGDGASIRGRVAEYIYYSPGVYQVVLSGKSGERQAVARTTVEVLPADITLSIADTIMGTAVRIANNLDREVNIGRMILQIEGNGFALPNDLIIDAGDTITLSPKDYLVSRGGELKMMTGEGLVLYQTKDEAKRLAGEIDRLKRELAEMEKQRGLVYTPAVSAKAETAGVPETPPAINNPDPDQIILNPQRSWWQKLLGW